MSGFSTGAFLVGLAVCAAGVLALVLGAFAVAVRRGLHRYVDVVWGLGFAVVAVLSVLVSIGSGDVGRRVLLLVLTAAWGIRLGTHIGLRGRGQPEDPRYQRLMDKAPDQSPRGRNGYALRKVYLTQAAALFFVSLPVQVGAYEHSGLGVVAWLGVAVWAVGMVFETGGDYQLTRFKADPANRGQVMDRGLWRYTRHPNYFGDACVWWGLFLVAADQWQGLLTVLSPLVMTYLLARGTGKPLLESGMRRTRPGYADYVARTSGFVPLPPRSPATTAAKE